MNHTRAPQALRAQRGGPQLRSVALRRTEGSALGPMVLNAAYTCR